MLWQMQSAHFSVRCFSLDVAGGLPCIVNVTSHQKNRRGVSSADESMKATAASKPICGKWPSIKSSCHRPIAMASVDGGARVHNSRDSSCVNYWSQEHQVSPGRLSKFTQFQYYSVQEGRWGAAGRNNRETHMKTSKFVPEREETQVGKTKKTCV